VSPEAAPSSPSCSAVRPAARTDGRSPGGFTPEARAPHGHANAPELSVWRRDASCLRSPTVSHGAHCASAAERGAWCRPPDAQALLNAPVITTTKGLRDTSIIAVLLGCALRPRGGGAHRWALFGGFAPEATGGARRAHTQDLTVVVTGRIAHAILRTCFGAPCGSLAQRGVPGGAASPKCGKLGRNKAGK